MVLMGELYDHSKTFTENQGTTRAFASDVGEICLYCFDILHKSAFDTGDGYLPFESRSVSLPLR